MVALLPAMRRLNQALNLEGLTQVRVTTPHYLGILAPSNGIPSNATFRPELASKVLLPMLKFLNDTGSPLMVNAYPYFSYTPWRTLDYAIFRPNRGIYDPATKLNYTSMLDAQMDAVYTAMRKLGFGGVQIAVGEAGWPTKAEAAQVGVGVKEAQEFNAGMIRICSGGKGTPLMPGKTFETYIFSLFDENQKPGPIAERNFGIFNTDLTPKVVEHADFPNNVQSHASYVMNAYYQANGRHDYDCDFKGTGLVTSNDPSYGSCKYVS
ncbi:hypothetical protein PR202_ga22796 [Eleusine coracana subsp. coracana]|uniref:X8 domain-containing protein n=1 Tax=Eleusine coracana subsp. coracana TaxID=191504 RepID=A0AAV5D4X7_ELECO|nr:hypothetical protein PR202_ga22796 [Eleusine coracana subsp. coracana]